MNSSKRVSDIRTQIYLPKQLHQAVKEQADSRGVSMAKIIREAVILKVGESTPTYSATPNDLLEVAGIFKGEPADISQNISKYIKKMYQEKK